MYLFFPTIFDAYCSDKDEVMTDVEADIDDDMTIDMEAFEEIVGSSEKKKNPNQLLILSLRWLISVNWMPQFFSS